MDIQKAKILLEKVNALMKSVSIDADNISNIEKDLMLSYIRQLYDAVLLGETTNNITTTKIQPRKTTPRPKPPVFEIEREEPAPPPPPRRIKVTPEPEPTYTPPRIIEVSDSLADMSTPAPPPPQPVVKKVKPTPPPAPKPAPVTPMATSEEQEGLFEFKVAKELSEKLSERPIRDLTKAFALNDKLLYANELFGKELVVFNESIRQLNGMQNFAEAKGFLSQLATKHNWTKGERAKVAKDFVKLVRRRYI